MPQFDLLSRIHKSRKNCYLSHILIFITSNTASYSSSTILNSFFSNKFDCRWNLGKESLQFKTRFQQSCHRQRCLLGILGSNFPNIFNISKMSLWYNSRTKFEFNSLKFRRSSPIRSYQLAYTGIDNYNLNQLLMQSDCSQCRLVHYEFKTRLDCNRRIGNHNNPI